MDDEAKACMATPAKDLRDHVMNVNIAKSEAEWWARAEIERLEALLATQQEAPSSDVVAFLHKGPDGLEELTPYNFGAGHLTEADKAAGWTEIPLYAALASTAGDTLKAAEQRGADRAFEEAERYRTLAEAALECEYPHLRELARLALGSEK